MSITRVDIIRSQEAAQLKHMDLQRSQQAQVEIAKSFQKKVNQEQQKPVKASKSENNEYRYDAKEKGNNQYKDTGNKKDNKEKKSESKEAIHTGGIDLLI